MPSNMPFANPDSAAVMMAPVGDSKEREEDSGYPANGVRLAKGVDEEKAGSKGDGAGTPGSAESGSDVQKALAANDWTGPNDPENPHNWTISVRVYNTAATGLLGFAATFASSAYTPAVSEVMRKFHVSETASILGLSLYTLGLAFGPLLGAPVSETLGRLVVYRYSIPIFALFTVGAGFSQTFTQLLVCRFFAGMFSSPVLAVGGGTNADLWPTQSRAVATSSFLMAPFLGPAMGPVIGGFATMNLGWQWSQWCSLFVTVSFYTICVFQKETYKKIILKKRAKRLGVEKSKPPARAMLKVLFTVTLVRPLKMLVTEPIVAFLSLYVGFAFAVLFAFFAAFPIVFEGVYGFNAGEAGLPFLGVGLGVVLGGMTGIVIDRTLYKKKHREAIEAGRSSAAPEHRLYAAMAGSVGLPIGLFWFAWTARSDISYLSPIFATIPFAWGNLCIFLSSALYLMDSYGPLVGASALAANGLLRYVLGAAFPLFTAQMFQALGIHWATSLFGFVSILMLPIPWVLFKWGPLIRAKSRYDTTNA